MAARRERAAVVVCTHPGAAPLLQSAGVAVVLLGLDGARLGRLAAELRARAAGGRVAVFVGDPNDADDLSAAVVMATEQFGAAPVVVSSPAQARDVVAVLSASERHLRRPSTPDG